MRSQIQKRLIGLALLLLLGGGCGYDHGIDPIPYRLKGTIVFKFGPPQFYVREARLVVVKKVPPENFTTDVILSDPLPFSRVTASDTVRYEMVVTPGVYSITGILWRREGQAWNIANILGVYGIELDLNHFEFAPKEIIINQDQQIADSIDIPAYWQFADRDANIAGTINFKDAHKTWRNDTDFFVLGFYPEIPRPDLDKFAYLKFTSFQFILQRTPVDSFSYFAPVKSGKYKFIALFWKGKATSLEDVRALGIYRCPNDTSRALPNSVEVNPNVTIGNINFEADFSTLPVGVIFSAIENCGQP